MENNDWFVPKNRHNSWFAQRINERDDRRYSFKVKYCETCRRAYEKFWEGCKSELSYYDGFVTIGLERETCDDCSKVNKYVKS